MYLFFFFSPLTFASRELHTLPLDDTTAPLSRNTIEWNHDYDYCLLMREGEPGRARERRTKCKDYAFLPVLGEDSGGEGGRSDTHKHKERECVH
jgi:hypothetical protein